MKELILIAIGAALVNNVVLSQFLGICAFLGVSKKMDTAAGMGGAVIFVLTISSFVTSLIYKFILAPVFLPSILKNQQSTRAPKAKNYRTVLRSFGAFCHRHAFGKSPRRCSPDFFKFGHKATCQRQALPLY